MICEKCFKQIDDDSRFCIYCGASQTISESYNKGNLIIYSHNKKFGFKDKDTLEIVVPLKYDFIGNFCDDRAVVMINYKYGYVDNNGKEITRLKYDFAKESKGGYAPVKRDDKWSIIDIYCKEICPFKYDSVDYFSGNLALVSIKNKFSLINKNGKEITTKFYDTIGEPNDNFTYVKLDNKYGVIDNNGNEVIPLNYDSIKDFSDTSFKVLENQKVGLLDKNGKILIPSLYDDIEILSNDIFKLTSANKIGFFFLSNGIIDCQFYKFNILNDGSLAVFDGEKWKCFNNLGEHIPENNNFRNYIYALASNKKKKRRKIILLTSLTIMFLLSIIIKIDADNGKIGIIKEFTILLKGKEAYLLSRYNETHDIKILKNYLTEFPNGKYEEAVNDTLENVSWNEAIKSYTSDSFNKYLKEYPKGRYKKIAEAKLNFLKDLRKALDYFNFLISGMSSVYHINHTPTNIIESNNNFFIEYIIFHNLFPRSTFGKKFASNDNAFIVPIVAIISSISTTVELAYKRKSPNGLFKQYNGNSDQVRNGDMVFEEFHLRRGENFIQFKTAWRTQPSEWVKGTYDYIFYINGNKNFTQQVVVE